MQLIYFFTSIRFHIYPTWGVFVVYLVIDSSSFLTQFRYVIQVITNNNDINSFLEKNVFPTFTQSVEHMEWLKSQGDETGYCGVYNNSATSEGKKLKSLCGFSIVKAKRGKCLQIQHGPLVSGDDTDIIRQYLEFLTNIAKQHRCDFVRINPIIGSAKNTTNMEIKTLAIGGMQDDAGTDSIIDVFKKLKFNKTPFDNLPAITALINLKPLHGIAQDSADTALLSTYSKDIRKNVKKFDEYIKQNKIYIVVQGELDDSCKELYMSVVSKNGFVPSAYKKMADQTAHYAKSNSGRVYKAVLDTSNGDKSEGSCKTIGFLSVVDSGKYSANHHSATLVDKELLGNLNVTALLQHFALKNALASGQELYDLWGLSDADKVDHPWYNFSKFKRGFNGLEYSFVHGYDLPLNPKYWITNLYERFQKSKRGY